MTSQRQLLKQIPKVILQRPMKNTYLLLKPKYTKFKEGLAEAAS
jgi:hypothetical protein